MTEVFRYSSEMIAFLRYHRFGISLQDITDAFNKEFKTNKTRRAINRICMKHGLKADVNHGQFKKGATKHSLAVGSETINKKGYTLVKVAEPSLWKYKKTVIWEKVNGKVPKDFRLTLIDGNLNNVVIENLELINKAELIIRNKNGYNTAPEELKPAIKALSKLQAILSKENKKR